jgi:O-antigen/teichoic acid export membrane protein
LWREQLRFCAPVGGAMLMVTLNKSMGSLFIAKMMGPVALAHYAIGTYISPIITVLRNSLSDVLLPEMSDPKNTLAADPLFLWRRMTIAAAVVLTAAGIFLAKFADTIIVLLFSEEYRPAVIIFQIYLLVLLREILDFAVPLRAINRTAPIMHSNVLGVILNAALLLALLPVAGVVGAAIAYVAARAIEGLYMGQQTAKAYQISPRQLADWGDLGKVALAAAVAYLTLYGSFWADHFGLLGVVAGGACFATVYIAMLLLLRLPELVGLMRRLVHAASPSQPGA